MMEVVSIDINICMGELVSGKKMASRFFYEFLGDPLVMLTSK
jgi:hypothetical protein